ncbi:hypothetical protein [Amycolatopsis sp. CA-230715]|uniref:hypothetical protein n=1 Tax=Amycolatopsis sp. CA-230715 TaxID=2745196 RepID=UPI001C015422|nr:hypothetical protein [Amycolatopsis sp. CA-230715]QWF78195.1 hypothetical protein HUW46_01590 [Amycolatopsis sp. CA-230715]
MAKLRPLQMRNIAAAVVMAIALVAYLIIGGPWWVVLIMVAAIGLSIASAILNRPDQGGR